MARKRRGDDGGGYNWMDTYGDMVTLLLTFFIMLFSMSTIDNASWEVLVQAFSRNAPQSPQQMALPLDGETGDQMTDSAGEYDLKMKEKIDLANERPVTITELYDYLKAYIEANDMAGNVAIERDAMNNVYMRFDNNIFFHSDSAVLRTESYPILQFMGECIKSVEDQIFMVRVVGHTAAVTQKDYPVNDWELSSSRANQVVIYFEEQSGFDPTKLMANGYGKNRPRYPNATAAGRAKNRRVEIMILGNEFDTSDPSQLLAMLQQMTDMRMEASPENSSQILKSDITLETQSPTSTGGAQPGETDIGAVTDGAASMAGGGSAPTATNGETATGGTGARAQNAASVVQSTAQPDATSGAQKQEQAQSGNTAQSAPAAAS